MSNLELQQQLQKLCGVHRNALAECSDCPFCALSAAEARAEDAEARLRAIIGAAREYIAWTSPDREAGAVAQERLSASLDSAGDVPSTAVSYAEVKRLRDAADNLKHTLELIDTASQRVTGGHYAGQVHHAVQVAIDKYNAALAPAEEKKP